MPVFGLQGHQEHHVGGHIGLDQTARGGLLQLLQFALYKNITFFTDEVLVNQDRLAGLPELAHLGPEHELARVLAPIRF